MNIDEQLLGYINADENEGGLSGFSFKRMRKKVKKNIKKIAVVAAVGAGAYFGGPAIMSKLGAMGGKKTLMSAVTSKARKAVRKQVKSKLSPAQILKTRREVAGKSPAEVMRHPVVKQIANSTAVHETARNPQVLRSMRNEEQSYYRQRQQPYPPQPPVYYAAPVARAAQQAVQQTQNVVAKASGESDIKKYMPYVGIALLATKLL